MATIDQLAAQIRFGLEQLSSKNAHHEFEHLCRYLARARICENILPATGPVAAGGDQGRDFETFRTYLASHAVADRAFVGVAPPGPLAFACTLTQQSDLASKIKSDIETITGSGSAVADVHYFCSQDLPVAKRHALQHWARTECSVHLEVYDGQAISELLSARDVFWIAVRYLSIPSELYPEPPEDTSWYSTLRSKWKTSDCEPSNLSDFLDLKYGVRRATFIDDYKTDLEFWISRLQQLAANSDWPPIRRRVRYETAVATLRGIGHLEGFDDELRQYFSEIARLIDPADLEDCAVLLGYVRGARYRSLTQIAMAEVDVWCQELESTLETELLVTDSAGRRCALLRTLGYLCFMVDTEQQRKPAPARAIAKWNLLADALPDAPLFPLDEFADLLVNHTELVGEDEEFQALAARFDELLAKRAGSFHAAEKCRDRALVHYRQQNYLAALRELHRAKVNWLAEETLEGSLLACELISDVYARLGLNYAAKYYALAAAYIASHPEAKESCRRVPGLVSRAAMLDYAAGATFGFLDLSTTVLSTHQAYGDASQGAASDHITETVFHASTLVAFSRRLVPALEPLIRERLDRLGLDDYFCETIPKALEVWDAYDTDSLWSALEQQVSSPPFADTGARRELTFKAQGVSWVLNWPNDYENVVLAEEFAAALQVFLADLADTDLCLLPTQVRIHVDGPADALAIRLAPSNRGSTWSLRLPGLSATGPATDEGALLGAIATVLTEVSVLPLNEIRSRLKRAVRAGLSAKAFFGSRYRTTYRYFVPKELFDSTDRLSVTPPTWTRSFNPREVKALKAWDTPGPGYTAAGAAETLRRRYERSRPTIRYTIERLLAEPAFLGTLEELRAEGWLDWHVLSAVGMVAINHRVREKHGNHGGPAVARTFQALMQRAEEQADVPVPLEAFTVENLRLALHTSMASTLLSYGLECRQPTPDFLAISEFLNLRYRYWLDDVEHEPLAPQEQ